MHGVARVQVKGYADKRNRAINASRPRPAAKPNDGRWMRQLQHDMGKFGMAGAIKVGRSPDGPVH